MKRKIEHPAPSERELQGPRYWRSLGELTETPGFRQHLEREFPEGASHLDGVDRRHFFKIMAASFALGGLGLAGCRRPEANILPYGKAVEGVVPGLPLYFATAMPLRRTAIPLLAETHQGRPTKLEGNPTYAPHGGASSLYAQASILELYDPDRASGHSIAGKPATAAAITDLLKGLGTTFAASRGAGLAFLAGESSSPTRARLVAELKRKLPQALWAEYEPTPDEPPVTAARAVFGRDVKPLYRFAQAKRVLSLDADFLHAEAGSLTYARGFAQARKVVAPTDPMNRLYVVESGFSLTGAMADHRLRLASSHVLAFAAALAVELTGDASLASLAQGLDFPRKADWITACAKDLAEHRGSSLVVAGAHQPAAVHALAYALNAFLGNVGNTVDFVTVPAPSAASISDLAAAITAGSIQSLVILGGNPVYNAPADLGFADLLKKVPQVVRYGYYVDETTLAVPGATHLGAAHYLESWGDARTVDGTLVPVQPMILPLFNGLTEIELLAHVAGLPAVDPYTLVYETVAALVGGADAADTFKKFLHDGLLAGSTYPVERVTAAALGSGPIRTLFNSAVAPVVLSAASLEVRFVTDHKVDDGRFANNGWLQECPDPMTKIAWDNAIYVSPRLGKELGIEPGGSALQVARKETGNFVRGREVARVGELEIGGRKIRGPLSILPGLSNYTVIVPLGYGRTAAGRVGTGAGFDAYPLRTSQGLAFATGAKLTLTEDEPIQLANTQEHWSMEGRDLVREANFDEILREGSAGLAYVHTFGIESHSPAIYGGEGPLAEATKLTAEQRAQLIAERAMTTPRGNSLYETPDFAGPGAREPGTHQWGMSIDLNTCYGCNACVVACQAENNIPIVGKDQVLRGREMHWIRLDRYFSDGQADAGAFGGEGNKILPEDPQVSIQPIACTHCDTAPCETVCPVNATVHDEEGLNTMAYNRCIGTRYCANNCPFKVRRFNFLDWNKRQLDSLYLGPLGPSGMPELVKMSKNPEVTVRMRGVMEKCTYCVQRIQAAKIRQKVKAKDSGDVKVPDGSFQVACQQACPVDAIVFGDISDPTSAVSQAKARQQDYALLGYLNIRPRTTFLGKLRNPNSAMPDYVALPFSRQEYDAKNHPQHDTHGHDDHGHDHAQHGAQPSFGGLS